MLVVTAVAACGGTDGSSGDTLPEPPADASIDGVWRAIGATVDGVEVAGLDTVTATIQIDGGLLTGSSGCNQYETAVDVETGTITFGETSQTEAFCTAVPGEIDALFPLSGSATWSIDGDVLRLTTDSTDWTFERSGASAPTTNASTVPATVVSLVPSAAGTVEVRPVAACFPEGGEGPAPDEVAGQVVLPLPDSGERCIVGPAVGPGPVFGPPMTVGPDSTTGSWVVSPSVLPEARAGWDQATEQCYQHVDPCASARIAIVVDGTILTAPTVVQPTLPEVQIAGDFTEAEARALAAAIAPESAASPGGGMDGPVMFAGPDRAVTVVAETLDGSLFLGDDCLVLTRDDQTTFVLVIWPYGTTWQPDGSGVVLPSGEVLGFGPAVELEGAVIDDAELGTYTDSAAVRDEIERCRRDETTQLFVAA